MTRKQIQVITLVVIILHNSGFASSRSEPDPFWEQPRISVKGGHLVLQSAVNKNITILSEGRGGVWVNNLEFSAVAPLVKSLLSGSSTHPLNLPTLGQKVQDLQAQWENFATVLNDLEQLQMNVSAIERRIAQLRNGGSRVTNARFRLLQRKVSSLETEVEKLKTDVAKDSCGSNPCRNGGTCINTYNSFYCQCPNNWEGSTCEIDVNECSRFAGTHAGCQNGATCYNTEGSYRCQCPPNWYGIHCTESHDDCSTASHMELCAHGTCINENRVVPGQPKYHCLCDQGWTHGNGPACDRDVDECAENKHTCSINPPVQCINLPGTFHCGHCPNGYTGNGHACYDINECVVNNGGCYPLVTCVNTVGSRQCGPCPAGFVGDGIQCRQMGICSVNRGGCHPLATCIENYAITNTFRECRCPPGYSGNGEGLTGCTPGASMTCASNPCVHGTCQMTENSFYCVCFPGFTGPVCSQSLNPCLSQPCQNGGTCSSQGDAYTCTCTENFEGPVCSDEKQSCGGFLPGQNGTLRYPLSSSQGYRNEENCAWIIAVDEGKVVNITLDAIHMESGPNCAFDFLQINDGPLVTSHSIARFCGIDTDIGTTVQSTHSDVYVWFRTDRTVTGFGFTISWKAVDSLCGAELEPAPYGAINSPGYPGNYPRNRDCYWLVRATPGGRLQFHFATLRLEHHDNCSFDFLKIFDGSREIEPVLSTYCTTITPPPLLTSGAAALLYFHSDSNIEDTGFHITYATVPSVHGCGGTLTTPTGSIQSPNYPDAYDRYLTCEWLIRIHPENKVELKFKAFEIEPHTACEFDYVEVYDGPDANSPLLGRFCGASIPQDLMSNTNNMFVKFRTDSSVQYNGFKATYRTICGGTYTDLEGSFKTPYYPDNYPSTASCYYFIVLPPGYLIQLQFQTFALETTGDCGYDYVQVRDGLTEESPLFGQYCGTIVPEPIVSTYNELMVKFVTDGSVTDDGFFANYSSILVGCGGVLTTNHGSVSTPAHPNVYPPDVTCNWIIRAPPGHIIQLTFHIFVLEFHSECDFDYVLVQDSNGAQIGKYCGLTVPPVLTSTDNLLRITFVADNSVLHEGFNASFVFLDASQTCGGNYFLETGMVRSPGFPENYPHNRLCTWVLHAEEGHQITLNITSFHLETHRRCKYDYLEIRNGGTETSPLLGKYCGEMIPRTFTSHSNIFYLKFASDSSQSAPGFEIFYDTMTTGCGGTLHTPSGSIVSPNYPRPYGHNAMCTWIIRVSEGSAVSLALVDLDIEEHPTCQFDYLQVFDGDSDHSRSLAQLCNNQQNPGPIKSSSNVMFIKFRTDMSTSGRGFHLIFHSLCNNVLTKRRGIIESPNFPNTYPHNHNCTWTVKAPIGSNITFSFSHLFLEHTSSCDADYIEINETAEAAANPKQLAKFCGTPVPLPPAIHTSTNMGLVRLVTDSSVTSEGFRLEYVVQGCGGEIKRSYGVISSPNYPNSYPLSTECFWHIKFQPGSQVRLQVTDLGLEWHSDCVFDFLKVYGGADETSPRLLKLCHRITEPITVTSHGSQMFIHFYSDSAIVGKGFSATYSEYGGGGCDGMFTARESEIVSPSYPSTYNANDECQYLIQIEEYHRITLEFYEFSLPQSVNCTNGYIAIYDGLNTSMPLIAKLCGEKPSDPVFSSTGNEMLMILKGDGENVGKGFRAHYKASCGSRLVADQEGEITSPNYPYIPVESGNCSWIISAADPGEKVTLIFTYLRAVSGLYVVVQDGDQPDSPSVGQYSGYTAPPPIISQGSSLRVTSILHAIFRATFGVTSSYCGGTLHSDSGSFSSPDFPNNYPMGTECIWSIEASAGNKVQISFRSFNLAVSDYCNTDYVEIHENDASGRLIGRYCGAQIPSNVTVAHKMWIKFHSEEMSTAPGFLAYYSLLHGSQLNGTEGIIESPGYPTSYYHNAGDYQWLITVPPHLFVSVQFLELDITPSHTYCWVAVKIYDGLDTSAPELGSYCGFVPPEPIISSGNVILIVFSGHYLRGKWKLQWLAVNHTTGIIEEPTGASCWQDIMLDSPVEFTSPGYPQSYEKNLNCTWLIRSSDYEHVNITFMDVVIEGALGTCSFDKIEVYTAPLAYVDSWELNSTLCGRVSNVIIESPTNLLKVMFLTDSFIQYEGFHAKVEPACGSHLYGTSGHIKSVDLLQYISEHQSRSASFVCEWIVSVRQRRTIQITFKDFNLPSDGVCSNMYFLLLNGGQSSSPMLGNGKYCGTSIPSLPETSSNMAFIRLNINSFSRGSPQFELHFAEVPVDCGGHLYITDDTPVLEIKSPNYPSPPSHALECSWIVMSPPGTRMRVDFDSEFHMSPECYFGENLEYVELLDGGSEYAEPLHRFCGTDHPASQLTTGNTLYIAYLTQLEHPGSGFKATVQAAECGGVVTGYYGTVSSPRYPANYSSSLECEWIIKSPVGYLINIDLLDIETPAASNCSLTDYLEIKEENQNGELKAVFCGLIQDISTTQIQMSGSNAYVRFKSDSARTGKGFRLSFNTGGYVCGGWIDTPSGVITSPNYPNVFSQSQDCYWFIMAPEGRIVTLTFTHLNLPKDETTGVCISSLNLANSTRFDEADSIILCGNELPEPVDSSGRIMSIRLRAHGLNAGEGFSLQYTTDKENVCGGILVPPSGNIETPNTSLTHNTLFDCTWMIDTQQVNTTVTFRFDVLDIPGSMANYCRIAVFYLSQFQGMYLGRFCGNMTSYKPSIMSPYQKTSLRFLTYSKLPFIGIHGTYNMSECGGVLDGTETEITSPGYPNGYPPNMDCKWIFKVPYGEKIQLTTLDMRLEENCQNDYVIVRDGIRAQSPILGRFCGTQTPAVIISDWNWLSITFHSNDYGTAPGFKMTTTEIQHGCGGLVHAAKGHIISPNYPQRYENNVECVWTIELPPGNLVNATFVDRFDIEMHENCDNDYLLLEDYDEGSWHEIGKKCGHETPPSVVSRSTKLRIKFHSNSQIQGDGFKIQLSPACGGHFTESSGVIFSPNYPEFYSNDLVCKYLIGDPQHYVSIKFDPDKFHIEYETNCTYDAVSLYRGNSTSSELQGKYCGTNAPEPFFILGQVLVLFESDYAVVSQGFVATYEISECGGIRSDGFGIIASPNYSNRYLNLMDCKWIIQASPNRVISLRFLKFELELHDRCSFDYVDIYDGNSTSGQFIGKFCGAELPPILKTNTNLMTLRFSTDGSVTHGGFVAYYYSTYGSEQGCGGTLISPSGEIVSFDINKDGQYEPNVDCVWYITGSDEQVIQINFSQFNVESSPNNTCNYDYVEIRDGLNNQDPLIGHFCGDALPPVIKTSSNKVSIIFHTDGKTNKPGFRATYTSVPTMCGPSSLLVTNVSQVLSSPNYPSTYPLNVYCRWHFFLNNVYEERIHISFTDMDVPCDSAFVEVHTESVASPSYRLCGPTHPHELIASHGLWMSLHSYPNADVAKGFSLTYQIAGCDRNYTQENGVILNPMYPRADYNRNCVMLIKSVPGQTVSLYFGRFSLISGNYQCSQGNLTIYDGETTTAPSLGTFCGSVLPNPIFSTGHNLLLKVSTYQRFSLYFISYTTTDKGRGCGGILNHVNGTFSSPFYPAAYNKSSECAWKLSVPGHHTMTVTFTFFSLNSSSGCASNYLELYEGFEDAASHRVSRFCGVDHPGSYISQGSRVLVKLVTDSTNTGSGFLAHFYMNTVELSKSPSTFILQPSHAVETPTENVYDIVY